MSVERGERLKDCELNLERGREMMILKMGSLAVGLYKLGKNMQFLDLVFGSNF